MPSLNSKDKNPKGLRSRQPKTTPASAPQDSMSKSPGTHLNKKENEILEAFYATNGYATSAQIKKLAKKCNAVRKHGAALRSEQRITCWFNNRRYASAKNGEQIQGVAPLNSNRFEEWQREILRKAYFESHCGWNELTPGLVLETGLSIRQIQNWHNQMRKIGIHRPNVTLDSTPPISNASENQESDTDDIGNDFDEGQNEREDDTQNEKDEMKEIFDSTIGFRMYFLKSIMKFPNMNGVKLNNYYELHAAEAVNQIQGDVKTEASESRKRKRESVQDRTVDTQSEQRADQVRIQDQHPMPLEVKQEVVDADDNAENTIPRCLEDWKTMSTRGIMKWFMLFITDEKDIEYLTKMKFSGASIAMICTVPNEWNLAGMSFNLYSTIKIKFLKTLDQ